MSNVCVMCKKKPKRLLGFVYMHRNHIASMKMNNVNRVDLSLIIICYWII